MKQPDLQNLFSYFRNSMSYLLQEGEEFAGKYPAIAKELNFSSNKISDPHVKRILEAFAFFDARLQYQIDDQMSELSSHLLNALYPQFTSPIPSCTIVQLSKIKNITQKNSIFVPKNTQIITKNTNNYQCTFSTTCNVKLTNTKITTAQYIKTEQTNLDAKHSFILSLEATNINPNQEISIFINSDSFSALSLYENIIAYDSDSPTPIYIANMKNELITTKPIGYIYPKGFERNESLFDIPQYCNDLHRTLLEYSCFPEKFFFIDMKFNDFQLDMKSGPYQLLIPLSEKTNPKIVHLHKNIFATNCVPAINLFKKGSEPLLLNHQVDKYKLMANQSEENFEIHSIKSLFQYDETKENNKAEYSPYLGFYNYEEESKKHWYSIREKSKIGGSDLFVSFVDPEMNLVEAQESTIFADLLCTNRKQASEIKVNTQFQVQKIEGISCQNIIQPTEAVDADLNGKNQWRVVSNLSLNHVDVGINQKNIKTLQKMFDIYSLRKDIKQHNKSIVKLNYTQSIGRNPNISSVGSVPKIIFDLTLHNYTPEVFLLGTLLSHILLQCVPFNTFVDVNLYATSNEKNVWKTMRLSQ